MIELSGVLNRLVATDHGLTRDIEYALAIGEFRQPMNDWLGQGVELTASGGIRCRACARPTAVSYGRGHCYACFKSLPSCDVCIRSPDRCHFAAGTCRDPAWGEANCMRPHLLYLAVSSGVKVGLTHTHNIPGRWLDQGAQQATIIAEARTRHIAGLMEVMLAQHVTDRTDWRKMLIDSVDDVDLLARASELRDAVADDHAQLLQQFGSDALRWRERETIWRARYPRHANSEVPPSQLRVAPGQSLAAILLGIKGQYLLFDRGVLNVAHLVGHDIRLRLGVAVKPLTRLPRQASLF